MEEEIKNNNEMLKKINTLSESMGYGNEEKTVVEIRSTDDPHIKELVLQSGSWDDEKPMFAFEQKKNKKAYVFISVEQFAQFLNALHASKEENFNLKLEKTILKYIPADFDDVWVVAMDKIKKLTQDKSKDQPLNINLDQLIHEIKKEYPNLFLNLKEYFAQHLTE